MHLPLLPHLPPLRLLPLLPLVTGCELTEVTVAPGERIVVVQSVITRGAISYAVVEYSQTGEDVDGRQYDRIPPGIPRTPVGGALVTITHANGACAGLVDTLREVSRTDPASTASGTYQSGLCEPSPGDQLLLRVETPAGEVVTGSTTVPGASAREVTWGARPAELGYPFAFNRELDSIKIGVTPVSGRAIQMEVRNSADFRNLAFFAFTDTMGINIPGNLVNPFDGDSGETIFRAGRNYTLAVALLDSNYYDYLRSSSDPFTGRGFLNHLNGGIGVFGSVETTFHSLHVVAQVDDPKEGVYRLTGVLDTVNVDVRLEVYLDEVYRYQFSAFVRGWPSGNGGFRGNLSSDGTFSADGEMRVFLQLPFSADTLSSTGYEMRGLRPPDGAPFLMIVNIYSPALRAIVVDTLTAQQISGPGLATASLRR